MKRYKSKIHEKAPRIVKDVLTGIHEYARTFGIMTAENPMGKQFARSDNKARQQEFFSLLKRGRYQFVKIKGKYGNVESPILILNIPLKELKYFGDKYNQESIIYGEIQDYQHVHFEYWERNSDTSPLVKKDEVDYFHTIQDADDFYSSIKGWKFTIPFPIFQEAITSWYTDRIIIMNEQEQAIIKQLFSEIVVADEQYTGHHFYRLRGNVNYLINTAKKRIM